MKKKALLVLFASLALITSACGSSNDSANESNNSETANESEGKDTSSSSTKDEGNKESAVTNADNYATHIPLITEEKLELSDQSYEYIKAHIDLFPAKTPETVTKVKQGIDASVTSKHLNKNATPYLETIISVSGSIVQIEEDALDDGTPIAIILLQDNEFNAFQAVMYNTTGDILEGDSIQIWGLPLGPSYFDNISGGTTNVQVLAASHVEKL